MTVAGHTPSLRQAREVVGIEARRELIDQFSLFPDDQHKAKVSFIEGDIFDEVPRLVADGQRFDIVAIYGLFYHIGYSVEWADWSTLPEDERGGVGDYFPNRKKSMMVRDTCSLRHRTPGRDIETSPPARHGWG